MLQEIFLMDDFITWMPDFSQNNVKPKEEIPPTSTMIVQTKIEEHFRIKTKNFIYVRL
jgi:hypothetical protein